MAKNYFTIEEASRGATYQHRKGQFTVYEIGVYGRGSVLEGQDKRMFRDTFDSVEAAKLEYPEAELIGGSTCREPYLGHLPDTERDI